MEISVAGIRMIMGAADHSHCPLYWHWHDGKAVFFAMFIIYYPCLNASSGYFCMHAMDFSINDR
jgi:hypothetical protein